MYSAKDNEFIAWYPNRLDRNAADQPWTKREAAYYIHVPFCTAICDYCGFAIERLKNAQIENYFVALEDEIRAYADRLRNYRFVCGHFGGGTPSAVPPAQISRIKTLIDDVLDTTKDAEVTIEVNPLSFDYEKMASYSSQGINRLSIGIQSFSDRFLKIIGRPHRNADVIQALKIIKDGGWTNFSIDLMYGFPGQSLPDLEDDLQQLVMAEPAHISCFRLEIIPFTVLKLREGAGLLPPRLSRDALNEMDIFVAQFLQRHGYTHYGAFNFTKPGYESVHNRIAFVAPQGEYVGFGNSAYSFIGDYIYCNHADVGDYQSSVRDKGTAIALASRVSTRELMSRFFVLGLKFFRVSRLEFMEQFGIPPETIFEETLARLVENGMLEIDADDYVLTQVGRLYVNNVCKEFFTFKNRSVSQYPQFVPTITREQVEHFARISRERNARGS